MKGWRRERGKGKRGSVGGKDGGKVGVGRGGGNEAVKGGLEGWEG